MYLKIGHKEVGENNPVFIIAELSANHLGNFNLAVKLSGYEGIRG